MPTGRVVFVCSLAAIVTVVALVAAVLLMPMANRQRLYLRAFGDTEYAPGYKERAFEHLPLGATHAEVITALGPPLSEDPAQPCLSLLYAAGPSESFARNGQVETPVSYTIFDFVDGELLTSVGGQLAVATGPSSGQIELDVSGTGRNHLGVTGSEQARLIAARSTRVDIEARYGTPTATYRNESVRWLKYSRSPSSSSYEQRWIGLDRGGRVCSKRVEVYID